MKSGRLFVALSLGLAISLLGSNAEAQRIAFVSNAGPALRPDELLPLVDALEEQGILVSPQRIRDALGPRFPMAAHDSALSGAAYAKLLDQAISVWTQQPPLEKMLPVLDTAADAIRRNPLLLIRDPSQRPRVHKIFVARALAYQRAGDLKRSEESMAELICMSPNYVVSRSQDGPAAEQLFQLTRTNQGRRGRGTLTVRVSQPDVQVYIDERITRPGVPLGDLIPCLHRVVLIDPLERARQYEPVVVKDQNRVLEVDWDLDPAVYEMPGWVELRFQTETERLQRAELAGRLLRSTTGADLFVLIDVIIEQSRRHIIASLRRVRGGQVLREASFVTTGADAAAMRALARFIGGGPPDPSIRVRVLVDLAGHRDPVGTGAPPAKSSTQRRTIGKITAAGGGAAIATSVVLGRVANNRYDHYRHLQDGPDSPACRPVDGELICSSKAYAGINSARQLGDVGTIVGAAGVAAMLVGGYLWYFAPRSYGGEHGRGGAAGGVSVVPTVASGGGGLAVVGRF